MPIEQKEIPNIVEILRAALQRIDTSLQPLLLAKLERLAAQRYRTWAAKSEEPTRAGLLACADREEEIASRVEFLVSDAASIQDRILSENQDLLELNRTLFEGRPLTVQFTMQAEGERAGAAAWNAFAAATQDPLSQEVLRSCSTLEQANADYLRTLL